MVYNGLGKLYEKYIDSSTALLQVNISSNTKYNLTNLFLNNFDSDSEIKIEVDKVLIVMEAAVKEISYLMNDSTSRFRKQSIIGEIIQITNDNFY